ncbi:MAG: oxygenase MpaB family protein [Acidimicrobiia bacterium]
MTDRSHEFGDHDPGLFGPGSVAWRIHADPAMLIGGLRAILVQALEPRSMAAVDQHSRFREDPWGRLERTTNYVVSTTYGTTADAEESAARVRRVHAGIRGVDPVTELPYSADDPELLLWIHAVEVESFLLAYRTYAGRVDRADADRYVGEMARAAELLGLPASMAPRSELDLRDYLQSVRGLRVTPAARDGLRIVLFPPMRLPYRPLWAIPTTAAVAILPGYARRLYRIPWVPPAGIGVRAGVFALSRALNLVTPPPPALRAARARVQLPS